MLKLSVTLLAEFVHRRGDLHARLDGRARPEEGIRVQRAVQERRALQPGGGGSYQRERALSLETRLAGEPVLVSGRIDGCDLAAEPALLEEYKTTRADPALAHGHHESVHWAQIRLYAGLLAREPGAPTRFALKLLYCHPDDLTVREYQRLERADVAEHFLVQTLQAYERWLVQQQAHTRARDAWLSALAFPFPAFRPHQRAMARRAYRALRAREHLLLEAPTGSGKTAAVLYPALRALESEGYRRVFFLTSRTTGAVAARDALQRMDPQRQHLRHLSLTAKDKACFLPGTPCEPDACPYARGYHDRARDAVVELLEHRAIDPETTARVAEAHTVCPFELSLDAALWCDLVVGDYNYLFDPVVRLKRFTGDPDAALLIDESHQLSPRVRDMLSLEIDRAEVKAALAEADHAGLGKPVRAIDRALTALKRAEDLDDSGEERVVARPEALLRAMQRFAEAVTASQAPLHALPATRALLFTCSRWLRAESWYQPEGFLFLADAARRRIRVRLVCLDPASYMKARFAEFGGHVRFSGTLSPLRLYQRLHGVDDGPAERAGNPFAAEQLQVLVVDDVPTYFRQRGESLPRLVALVEQVLAARAGHYLAAFPSFDYLDRFVAAFAAAHPRRRLRAQQPGMDDAARAEFIEAFAGDAEPLLGAVVLGGVFGESVDFTGARLDGVICVGVGLPPPSLPRAALAAHFDREGFDGRAVAYHQPAMVKVLQMAGRVLRGPQDRGVLCLVDRRFRDSAYQHFFPAHWRPEVVQARQVADRLANFWQEEGAFPRLRGEQKQFPQGSQGPLE